VSNAKAEFRISDCGNGQISGHLEFMPHRAGTMLPYINANVGIQPLHQGKSLSRGNWSLRLGN